MSGVLPPSARLLRGAAVVVLAVDAALLGLTELAWLTLATGSGAWVPVAVVVAAVATPVLTRAADRCVPRSPAPLVVLVAWALPVLVVGAWSPAGEGGTLPVDYRSILLLAAGLIPGVLSVVVRPAKRPAGETPSGTPHDAPGGAPTHDAPGGAPTHSAPTDAPTDAPAGTADVPAPRSGDPRER